MWVFLDIQLRAADRRRKGAGIVGENRLLDIAHSRLRVYTKHREYKYSTETTVLVRARHVLEMCRCDDGRNLVCACLGCNHAYNHLGGNQAALDLSVHFLASIYHSSMMILHYRLLHFRIIPDHRESEVNEHTTKLLRLGLLDCRYEAFTGKLFLHPRPAINIIRKDRALGRKYPLQIAINAQYFLHTGTRELWWYGTITAHGSSQLYILIWVST